MWCLSALTAHLIAIHSSVRQNLGCVKQNQWDRGWVRVHRRRLRRRRALPVITRVAVLICTVLAGCVLAWATLISAGPVWLPALWLPWLLVSVYAWRNYKPENV